MAHFLHPEYSSSFGGKSQGPFKGGLWASLPQPEQQVGPDNSWRARPQEGTGRPALISQARLVSDWDLERDTMVFEALDLGPGTLPLPPLPATVSCL